ncbi:hypothetical protein GINT2_001911 [Glugoides intestinalis]
MPAKFLIVTGPSGAGKSSLIEHLLGIPLFEVSVSYTTRSPRVGEVPGKQYFFITKEEFERKIKENFFVEFTVFNGNYYGTPSNELDEDKVVVLDIELDGMRFFSKTHTRSFFCLVTVDRSVMEKRLFARMRTEEHFSEEELLKRMESFDLFKGVEKTFNFNKIIDNSGGVEDLQQIALSLADEVIEYYKM